MAHLYYTKFFFILQTNNFEYKAKYLKSYNNMILNELIKKINK